MHDVRIGFGYDSHRFQAGRRLVLCGVEVPCDAGLAGHSDADAATHAVIDALFGAAALGDIGSHFPDSDDRWLGADSAGLLAEAVREVRDAGWAVGNVDVTIICERPKIGPHVGAMRSRLAAILGVGADAVSVKGKTDEGMGAVGAGEGVVAHAVCILKGDGR